MIKDKRPLDCVLYMIDLQKGVAASNHWNQIHFFCISIRCNFTVVNAL